MTALPLLAATRLFGVPLLIGEAKAATILSVLGDRVGVQVDFSAEPRMGRVADPMTDYFARRLADGRRPYAVVDRIAVLPMEGTLVNKGAYIGAQSGVTSYQGIQTMAEIALRDPDVAGVVYEVDSHGGEVAGAFSTADALYRLSQAKPTMAILTDHAYSAGYLLASQARQIVAPRTGGAGSIGAIAIFRTRAANAAEVTGEDVTVVRAGARKALGNPFEALPEGYVAQVQARLDEARADFVAAVARGRGARLDAAAAMATEAEVYGAAEALTRGLIDAVDDPTAAFRAFADAVNRKT